MSWRARACLTYLVKEPFYFMGCISHEIKGLPTITILPAWLFSHHELVHVAMKNEMSEALTVDITLTYTVMTVSVTVLHFETEPHWQRNTLCLIVGLILAFMARPEAVFPQKRQLVLFMSRWAMTTLTPTFPFQEHAAHSDTVTEKQ